MTEELPRYDKVYEEGLRAFDVNDQCEILEEALQLVATGEVKGLGLGILTRDGKVRLAISCKDDGNIELLGVLEMLKHKATVAAFLPAPAKGATRAEPQ